MQVKQIYELVNDVTGEVLGKTDLLAEDLSNVVDLGNEIFDAGAVDNYVRSLIDHIGKVVFVNRPYTGSAPSVLMDSWEYGSVMEKIQMEIPATQENDAWQLENGKSYDQDIFYKPVVTAKFYNSKTTFEIPMSFTEDTVKESFSNATQLNAFMSMIYSTIDKALTINLDALIMRTINNMTATTLLDAKDNGGVRAVNLLTAYNEKAGTSLTAAEAVTDPDFIRYATYMLKLYAGRIEKASTLFNIGGKVRYTSPDYLHIVLLDEFASASEIYLQSDTFHNELAKLPAAETVTAWQGSGTGYDFADTSKIDVTVKYNDTDTELAQSGILGVMFDRDALGVCNTRRKVTPHYNARGDFFTNFYKVENSYFNDTNENFIVFYVA